MVVKVGRISATCPVCEGTDFLCAVEKPTAFEVMTCANCKLAVTYAFLTDQIAGKALEEARATREELERRREGLASH
jgi:hypothetical protein